MASRPRPAVPDRYLARMADMPWGDLALTPLDAADAAAFHRWQNDPRLRDLTMGYRYPIQRPAVEEWIAGLRSRTDRTVYAIRVAGDLVGMVNLHGIDPLHRHCELGIFIGGDVAGRAGPDLSWMSLALLVDFAFNGLNLHRINIETLSLNTPIRRIVESLGFREEGTRRQDYFADGAYWDITLYGMIAGEFAVTLPPAAQRLCRRMRKPGAGAATIVGAAEAAAGES